MDPETLNLWVPVVRDIAIVIVCSFILIWQTVFATEPNGLLIGAACTLLVSPAAFRLDASRRRKAKPEDADDRWSHLP